MLFPPSVQELVPEAHLPHFIRDSVRDSLNLSAIVETYREERGFPPYDPVMISALLLYTYCQGLYAARRIATAGQERIAFMAVTALQRPDFRTVSDFRKRHLTALGELFTQVLTLCQASGLVQLGHVALDGTKLKANASKHKAISDGRMQKTEADLTAAVQGWLQKAEGFVPGYNAQAAVDAVSQIIVAQRVTNALNDQQQLAPLITHIKESTGPQAQEVSADAGYCCAFLYGLTAVASCVGG